MDRISISTLYKILLLVGLATIIAFALQYEPVNANRLPNDTKKGISPRPSGPTTIFLPLVFQNYFPPSPLWRFGFAKARLTPTAYDPTDISAMRFGWYLDYTTGSLPLPQFGIEYVPMVRVKQWKSNGDGTLTLWCITCTYALPYTYTVSINPSQIQSMAQNHPGMTWVIGNEMERRDWTNNDGSPGRQDEMLPEVYAQAYHEVYATIKTADPTAKVAIGGVIEATALRLKYLDLVWNAYQNAYGQAMPVDIWNVHAFVLREKSCAVDPLDCWGAQIPAGLTETLGLNWPSLDATLLASKDFSIVQGQIYALRSWMQQHGQQNKPLFITESGVLYPDWVHPGYFTPAQIRDSYMYPAFNFYLNQTDSSLGYAADGYRLVQRWIWYSLDDDSRFAYAGLWYDNLNGYLFYSGLEANPRGLSQLGTMWKQYVQSLPVGGNPPY